MNFTTFYLLLCIIFAGRGDERWKKRTRNDAHRVIGVSDEYAEMERNLWAYEDDFDIATEKQFYSNLNLLKQKNNDRERVHRPKTQETNKKSVLENFLSDPLYNNNRMKNISKDVSLDFKKFKKVKDHSKEGVSALPKWPKFEELLLSVGVEYDWKSDRWIKLKRKLKIIPDKTIKSFNTKTIHQKHEFKYKTVRINGSKRRKNIIIALTAIR